VRISRTGLFEPAHPDRVGSPDTTGTWEWASECPPCVACRYAGPSAPSLHGHYPASPAGWADPTSPRRSLPLWFPLGFAPAAPARGAGGISRVPCASRPCVPTAEAPVDARLLLPLRATAAAFPAVAYGSASTVKGISGLVPFSPACMCGFRPTGFLSTLRPGSYPPPGARLGPSDRVARLVAGGTPCSPPREQVTHWEAPTWPGARNVVLDLTVSSLRIDSQSLIPFFRKWQLEKGASPL
jgi:hypothetical protein